MSWFVPPRQFDPAVPEMMDRRGNDPDLLRADLRVLERINASMGGHALCLHYLRRWRRPALNILDLATGGGDVPRTIVRWARKEGIAIQITAVDGNPEIIAIARDWSSDYPEICYEPGDLLSMCYPRGSFDVVLNSLTLHHFGRAEVIRILRTISSLPRLGYIINDLRRHAAAIWISRFMARTIITNPIAQFDAPASCARAFTVRELKEMADEAGLSGYELNRHCGYRMALVGRPGSDVGSNS